MQDHTNMNDFPQLNIETALDVKISDGVYIGDDNIGDNNIGDDNIGNDNIGDDNIGDDNIGDDNGRDDVDCDGWWWMANDNACSTCMWSENLIWLMQKVKLISVRKRITSKKLIKL